MEREAIVRRGRPTTSFAREGCTAAGAPQDVRGLGHARTRNRFAPPVPRVHSVLAPELPPRHGGEDRPPEDADPGPAGFKPHLLVPEWALSGVRCRAEISYSDGNPAREWCRAGRPPGCSTSPPKTCSERWAWWRGGRAQGA
jgi:hypothetical protein